MSVSVDDLVASLSANHIGQEATDLATLQTQLAQTLLSHQLSFASHNTTFHGVSVNIARRDPANVQHCTTPTARTPSSATFTWPLPVPDHADHHHHHHHHVRKRSTSLAPRQSTDDGWHDLEEMDEERIVEDMITSDSPRSPNAHLWAPKNDYVPSSSSVSSPTDPCTSSLFTSTDPFYLQASQSTQQPHTSFLSHVASSHSPFMVGVPSWQ